MIISKRRLGFSTSSLYNIKEPHAFAYISERTTFWIAVLSVFAFVTGNMVGQHGWHVFWKSVLGEGIESTIVFDGTVAPVAKIPDYARWSALGGDPRVHHFRQVPTDLLVPLPPYVRHAAGASVDISYRRVYYVEHLGDYATGVGNGSHPGVDISMPQGTPVQSVANGIVVKVADDPGGYGTYVVIKHPNVPNIETQGERGAMYSLYAHLSSALVTEGVVVQKGEEIALSGRSGNVTAPHLHFQMDKETAPYHPYWPFSGTEQRQAGLSFSQAIDRGLHRERGVEFTLDPMLTVQAYATFVPTATIVEASSSSRSIGRPRTIAERRAIRLARLGTTAAATTTTVIAYTEDVPVIPIPVASSSSVSTSSMSSSHSSSSSISSIAASASSVWVEGAGPVSTVKIDHDGKFGRERGWETVVLTLLDENGRIVTSVNDDRKLYLTTAYGKAEFNPSVVSLNDFRKGKLEIQMLPFGEQTVIIQIQPMGAMSDPMTLVRN